MSMTIDAIVERIDVLPRLRDSALHLVTVISDPASTIQQIVEGIRYDDMITAQVLRLCNSAFFGLARKVASLDDAIRYLGTTKVLQLVMAAHTQSMLSKPQEGYGLAPGALWLHSVGVALAGQMLAQRFAAGHAGVVFTSGLLHDIGKTVLNEYVAAEYVGIARMVSEGGVSFLEAERAILGFTHAEIGERVAERWSLPEETVRTIRYHHEPDKLEPPDPVVDAVHLADSICALVGIGTGHDSLLYRGSREAMDRRGMNEGDLETIGAETVVELKSVQKLFAAS